MKLVIIDDEKVICQGLSTIISGNSSWGWSVAGTYDNPEEALTCCNWDEIQCVLLDICMPSTDGLTFAHILHEKGFDIDVIFITAYSSFDYAQRAIDERPVAYLLKPISKVKLKEALDKAILSCEKKQKTIASPEYIKENINDLQKHFISDIIFQEKEYSEDELEQLTVKYLLADKSYSIYEVLTEIAYANIKETLRKVCKDIQWFVYGHERFFVIVFVYTIGQEDISEDIIHSIGCIYSIGEKKISDLTRLSSAYELLLTDIRNHYIKPTEIIPTANEQHLIEPDDLSISVKQVIKYIDSNLSRPLTLKGIAAEVYLHPTYLSNVFKKQTGYTLMNYINIRRINEAKKLLSIPNTKIGWVIEQVGFANRKYFEKVFKELVGMTPMQYKQDEYLKSNE